MPSACPRPPVGRSIGVVYPIFSCRRPTPRATAPPGLPHCSRPIGSRLGRSRASPRTRARATTARPTTSSARCTSSGRRPGCAGRLEDRLHDADDAGVPGHPRAGGGPYPGLDGAGRRRHGGACGPLPAGRRVRAGGSARARSRAGRRPRPGHGGGRRRDGGDRDRRRSLRRLALARCADADGRRLLRRGLRARARRRRVARSRPRPRVGDDGRERSRDRLPGSEPTSSATRWRRSSGSSTGRLARPGSRPVRS